MLGCEMRCSEGILIFKAADTCFLSEKADLNDSHSRNVYLDVRQNGSGGKDSEGAAPAPGDLAKLQAAIKVHFLVYKIC